MDHVGKKRGKKFEKNKMSFSHLGTSEGETDWEAASACTVSTGLRETVSYRNATGIFQILG